MASITTLIADGSTHPSRTNVKTPYIVSAEFDVVDLIAAKGGALASGDTIEAIRIPTGSLVKWVGVQVVETAITTTATVDVGYTGGDVDEWVDGFDLESADGTFSGYLAADPTYFAASTSADTIDVLFATLTGTLSAGKFRVIAELVDVGNVPAKAGIAQVGS